jgi:hypothetical protein
MKVKVQVLPKESLLRYIAALDVGFIIRDSGHELRLPHSFYLATHGLLLHHFAQPCRPQPTPSATAK